MDVAAAEPWASLLAVGPTDDVIGLASLITQADLFSAELGVVMEDQWQHHGIGRRLVLNLLVEAPARGIRTVAASIHTVDITLATPLRRIPGDFSLILDGRPCNIRITVGPSIEAPNR